MDLTSKRLDVILDDPRFHSIQARAVTPRAEPDGRSSVLTPEDPLGKFYCLDVYKTEFKDHSWLPRGTAKKLRVIEGLPRKGVTDAAQSAESGSQSAGGGRSSVPQLAQRRILGEVPLADDGSFNVEVPANLPIQLQLLDERGVALRSCGWIWTRNHEPQGCIGCHEDPELTPANRLANAVAVDSASLCPPPQQRQTVDFRREVMPIIAKKCSECHGPEGSLPRLTGSSRFREGEAPAEPLRDMEKQSPHTARQEPRPPKIVQGHIDDGPGPNGGRTADASARNVYEALLAQDRDSSERVLRWKYVEPGRARTSPLVWHVFGVNTSRPWDGPAASRPAKPIPPDKAQPLSAEEKALLVRWIDLGAPWESISAGEVTPVGRAGEKQRE
jgi:hypothetical protein